MRHHQQPPRFFIRFFKWFCDPKIHDFVEGDLFEVYTRRLKEKGKRKADLLFIADVLMLFRPGIIKIRTQPIYYSAMFRNNLKIALRSLWKHKASSIINVFGLTTGITSCLLIALFIRFESGFDKFQSKKDRIARVIMEYSFEDSNSGSQKGNFTSTKVAPVLSRTFPEVKRAIRMHSVGMIVRANDHPITEEHFMFADSSFFDAFDHEFLEGNPATALNGPEKIVLTESTAKRYFGKERATGKTLLIGADQKPYEVTGVVRDYPAQSQIEFNFLASFSSLHANQEETYFDANYTTYLLLTDANAINSLQQKLDPFMDKEMKGTGVKIRYELEPFDKIHLYSPYPSFTTNTSIRYLYILGGVGLLIIVIGCFTYINLSTARSVERAREVGIRKVSGAVRAQLFWQFIGESFVLCGLSVMVSFAITGLLLPLFNLLVEKNLVLTDLFSTPFILSVIGATMTISLLAGAYPAIILSRFQPVKVLKGVFKNTASAKALQQSLTVFQFAISVFLIVTTIVIQSQLYFIQNQKLGYDRDHVISLPVGWDTDFTLVKTLKTEISKDGHVKSVSRSANSPVRISSGYTMRLASMPEKSGIITNGNPVDESFIETAGLELIAGTNFTENQVQQTWRKNWDSLEFHYIINESAVKKLGFQSPEDAIGKEMYLNKKGTIVGVIKDFHFQSMRTSIQPLVLFTASWGNRLLVKVDGNDMKQTLAAIEKTWKELLPNRPFEYTFLDDDYNKLYHTETQLGYMMNVFTFIAIVLACVGLFGLSSYLIQQRMKEISIRKVLGASIWNLFKIISGNFVKLVFIAIVIALPVAYVLMQQWLDGFVYRIDLEPWMFIIAAVITIVIAIATVGARGVSAAIENPSKNLRSE